MFAALLLAPLLVFHGNVAVLEDVYRSALDLPANMTATPSNARLVVTNLAGFLHRAAHGVCSVRVCPAEHASALPNSREAKPASSARSSCLICAISRAS